MSWATAGPIGGSCSTCSTSGRVDPRPMITDMVTLDQLPGAFEALRKPTSQIKVMVRPNE